MKYSCTSFALLAVSYPACNGCYFEEIYDPCVLGNPGVRVKRRIVRHWVLLD